MQNACMATKTISLDMKAYHLLRQARRSEKESFSQVIHRAKWPRTRSSCGDLLDDLREHGRYLPAKEIGRLEQAQAADEAPQAKWS